MAPAVTSGCWSLFLVGRHLQLGVRHFDIDGLARIDEDRAFLGVYAALALEMFATFIVASP
ncbi:hypothetical protein RGCCGE502_17530 [Rhizobium grahamii CCGE 502]|uniref:Uncharacterized protein n=1 Tax=Rhizobium grahamii CCGE 502 TaxID=990285 RepID=S3HG01_9HYPH|nr:hypothetical protein RGCCGE502_17530 [Rhizobium grahamii CCGE 502]